MILIVVPLYYSNIGYPGYSSRQFIARSFGVILTLYASLLILFWPIARKVRLRRKTQHLVHSGSVAVSSNEDSFTIVDTTALRAIDSRDPRSSGVNDHAPVFLTETFWDRSVTTPLSHPRLLSARQSSSVQTSVSTPLSPTSSHQTSSQENGDHLYTSLLSKDENTEY